MAEKEQALAKKSIKDTPQPIIEPEVIPVSPPSKWLGYLPYIITGIFFILSLIGLLNHEMWRDEYQAWMVAADAHSIPQLFQNLKYEGNPVLWHSFLFIISALTDDPFGMQLFHILISTSFIFLINRYGPFPILQKVLLTFGYFMFYEYNLISRGYGLGLLLIVCFCILYQHRQKYILLMAAVLFVLANSTIFGIMIAVSFTGLIILERIFPAKKLKGVKLPWGSVLLFTGITALGVLLGYLQIKPEPDNSFPTLYMTDFDMTRAKWAFSRLIHAYFAIPNFTDFHWWNTNLFVPDETKFLIGITPVIFVMWIFAFLRYRFVLALYTAGTLLLILFYYYTGFIWARYSGHLYLLLFACCWLVYYNKEKPFKNPFLEKVSLLGNKMRIPLFILILSVHCIGGVMSYIQDLKHPFSTSEQATYFIRSNHLENLEIIGSKDYVVSPLAVQLDKKILYAERKEYGSFIIYDQKRTNIWSFKEVQAYVTQMHRQGSKQMLLVKDTPIMLRYDDTGETIPWSNARLTDSLNLKFLAKVDPGIVKDETYYIYSVDEMLEAK